MTGAQLARLVELMLHDAEITARDGSGGLARRRVARLLSQIDRTLGTLAPALLAWFEAAGLLAPPADGDAAEASRWRHGTRPLAVADPEALRTHLAATPPPTAAATPPARAWLPEEQHDTVA